MKTVTDIDIRIISILNESLGDYETDFKKLLDRTLEFGFGYNLIVAHMLNDMYNRLLNNYEIRKCLNCGKSFITPKSSTELFCNRVLVGRKRKTCRDKGNEEIFYSSDILVSKFRNLVSSAENDRVSTQFILDDTKDTFEKLLKELNRSYRRYIHHNISYDEFEDKLEQFENVVNFIQMCLLDKNKNADIFTKLVKIREVGI